MKDIVERLKDVYQGGLDWPTPTEAELVELVTRAICTAAVGGDLDEYPADIRAVYSACARAAIAALREAGVMK